MDFEQKYVIMRNCQHLMEILKYNMYVSAFFHITISFKYRKKNHWNTVEKIGFFMFVSMENGTGKMTKKYVC